MQRISKIIVLIIRQVTYRLNHLRLYYWCERKLLEWNGISLMPRWYYRCLFNTCIWLVKFARFRKIADHAIHKIPLAIRFEMA